MAKTLTIAPKGKPKRRGRSPRSKRSVWREYAVFVLVVVGLALVVRTFLVQGFYIPSRSMEDSLLVGDYLLVNKLTYGIPIPLASHRLPALADPQVGDVVIFRSPLDPERIYVKRCIAVGGQVIEIRNKVVYVDGNRAVDPPFSKYVDARIFPSSQATRDNYGPQRVPDGAIFVIGDNRDNSRDSRHWGPLAREAVIGRAICLYWSCEPVLGEGFVQQIFSLPQRIRWNRLGNWVE